MRCPITYQELAPGEHKYSAAGLRKLSLHLTTLNDFPYSMDEQIFEAKRMATKLSIQGIQPKLSVVLDVAQHSFKLADRGGTYILKPQSPQWPELPENEDVTMRMAALVGIEVPLHGLVYCKDGRLSYWVRRFDRPSLRNPLKSKLSMEDFAQLSEEDRQTKYNSSMEKVAKVIQRFCTFPQLENEKLFRLTLFNFIVGNEDMHLKNFSLMTRDGLIGLSPAYDLLNTTCAMYPLAVEEIALPINGKKNKLTTKDLIEDFGKTRLGLTSKTIARIFAQFINAQPAWQVLINKSFLSQEHKERYLLIVDERLQRLKIG